MGAVLLVHLLLLVAGAGQASAHTGLDDAVPAKREVVTSTLRTVELTYWSDVQADLAQVAVTGPDGGSSAATGTASVEGRVVRQPVSPGAPGTHAVAYRIVFPGGRPVEGRYRFTYRPAASSATASTPQRTDAAPPAASADPPARVDEQGSASWPWVAVLAGVAVAAGALAILGRRRRRTRG